jgi:hypothetical protein
MDKKCFLKKYFNALIIIENMNILIFYRFFFGPLCIMVKCITINGEVHLRTIQSLKEPLKFVAPKESASA